VVSGTHSSFKRENKLIIGLQEEGLMLQSTATRQIEEYFISTYKYIHSLSYAVVTFQKGCYNSSFVEVKSSIHTGNVDGHTHTHIYTYIYRY
jgi:hypothetical protein